MGPRNGTAPPRAEIALSDTRAGVFSEEVRRGFRRRRV